MTAATPARHAAKLSAGAARKLQPRAGKDPRHIDERADREDGRKNQRNHHVERGACRPDVGRTAKIKERHGGERDGRADRMGESEPEQREPDRHHFRRRAARPQVVEGAREQIEEKRKEAGRPARRRSPASKAGWKASMSVAIAAVTKAKPAARNDRTTGRRPARACLPPATPVPACRRVRRAPRERSRGTGASDRPRRCGRSASRRRPRCVAPAHSRTESSGTKPLRTAKRDERQRQHECECSERRGGGQHASRRSLRARIRRRCTGETPCWVFSQKNGLRSSCHSAL